MEAAKEFWKRKVAEILRAYAREAGADAEQISEDQVIAETPPKPELGDIAFPLFPFAKVFRTAPAQIAAEAAERLTADEEASRRGTAETAGAYLNLRLHMEGVAEQTITSVFEQGDRYGCNNSKAERRIMVEFSCPNTNKPLHLGHLRNDALGESVSRILKANGAEVRKVNLINDRGIHICKSMLAYEKFGGGATPESKNRKSDHFVGDYYVRFNSWAEEEPDAERQAREMLRKWEADDPEVVELWKRMNRWAIEGVQETYRRTDVSFDDIYYESRTYARGREEVRRGVEREIFYREEDGSIWADLTDIGLDKKVLLRSDGTSLYLTQDIGTAIQRYEDWPFYRLVYVVASEQKYHFRVLFRVLQQLGYEWAERLYHLSYGMVNLPEGKMKSREGTVVDADDLLSELQRMAAEEIRSKEREEHVGDVEQAAASVALGALHYYLLQASPAKDMVFDPRESISFNGNTGPYLQYMGARISSMLRKYEEKFGEGADGSFDPSLLTVPEERELVKLLAAFPDTVKKAGEEFDPSIITGYLYDLSRTFSRYYHDHPVLHNENRDLVVTRVRLSQAVLQVLKNAYALVVIPFLERM
jgi:arginyl-tRNA synthetase